MKSTKVKQLSDVCSNVSKELITAYKMQHSVSTADHLSLRILFVTVAPFSVSAMLYTLSNNLGYHILKYMDPVSYQVLSNFKIFTTAVLFRIILRKPLTRTQWIALILLMTSSMLDGASGKIGSSGDEANTMTASYMHITYFGIFLMIVYTTTSGFTAIYTEYIYKKMPEMDINLQNCLLYTFGILINGFLLVTSCLSEHKPLNLFKGFSVYTWIIVLTQSLVGISFGYVLKYASNITRLFIIGCSMVFTTLMAMLIWSMPINPLFLLTVSLIMLSLYLYHKE
ncbi:hypothetical protein Ciccas_008101 [Cichlidogyrus casuarinus]|uniref:UDP-sugar transporter protein SLC35A4 n=1 Tax=Cichlidogyrus casuarinus TaxID=1844966 RepID=A0ABD2Q192_9PLAT